MASSRRDHSRHGIDDGSKAGDSLVIARRNSPELLDIRIEILFSALLATGRSAQYFKALGRFD